MWGIILAIDCMHKNTDLVNFPQHESPKQEGEKNSVYREKKVLLASLLTLESNQEGKKAVFTRKKKKVLFGKFVYA